jgi:hypothetical protein
MQRILVLFIVLAITACVGQKNGPKKVLAKLGGSNFTEGDFEFSLKTLPLERQEAILKDPEARRKQFNDFLKRKLQAMAAEKSAFGKNPSLKRRLALMDKRVVTQNYYQTFLGENGGFTVKQLEEFYRANPSKFVGDSGKVRPFEQVRTQIADSILLTKAPHDSFYAANLKNYEVKAACVVYWIQTPNLKNINAAALALRNGMEFKDAVQKYSDHAASKQAGGRAGRAVKGETIWELGGINTDSLFFYEETKLKPGIPSRPFKKDANYFIVRADSCQPPAIPPLDSITRKVAEGYLVAYKPLQTQNALNNLKRKYGVDRAGRDKPVDAADLKKYYEAHKDNYFSPETYEVYHIESKDKDAAAKKIKAVKDLEEFKNLAGKISENAWTTPDKGRVGWIKRDHCLPYGIGMLPSLFSDLDAIQSGPLPAPVQNPDTKKWQFFWMAGKSPKQLKPFERVKAAVEQDYKSEKINTIKPEDALATYGKDKILREDDVLFLREEIPANVQERYTREQLVDFLLTWDLATMESEALGLTEDPRLQAQREENRLTYWAGIYQDSIMSKTAGLDSITLKKTFEANRAIFTKDSSDKDYHKYAHDISGYLALEPRDFDIEYHSNPDRYKRDTVPVPFEDARFEVFQNLKGAAFVKADDRMLERLKREFQVVVLDHSLLDPKITDPRESYKQAQNMHYDRKLDQALDLYQKLRDQFPRLETLQDSICFGMAQIYIEQEKYQQALAEYRRLSYLYPKSQNNYKAMFMVGFIYAEHIKNDSSAVRSFERMLAKYPGTDLSDDADWMIRNIRSGGKLMPVLEGDSGYVAPDEGKKK